MNDQQHHASDQLIARLRSIIDREHADGCCMADPVLIDAAIRRWRSYDRRNKRNKHKSFEHRVQDLKKGLMTAWGDPVYSDHACVSHLAESFADILAQDLI